MKQWFRLTSDEWLVILVSYPVVPIVNYLMLGDAYFSQSFSFLPVTATTSLLFIGFAWLMNAWKKYVQHRFPSLAQSTRRITLSLLMYIAATLVLVALVFSTYEQAHVVGYQFKMVNYGWVVLIGFVLNVLSTGVFEALYFYRQWQQSVAREYELNQLHMQRQLDVLKQQVNPHFLFNSLNSLISLIGENPQQAEAFAEELSTVYRYVLQTNRNDGPEQNLTDLNTELGFIQSYYHLLKTRHGNGLNLIINIDQQIGTYQLPPLTLQLLVENAVKHNIVLAEQPLTIWIETDAQARLLVRNTLQKKPTRVLSNGIGLTNILAKYQLLGQALPTIQETGEQFVVTLPLIPFRSDSPIQLYERDAAIRR